MKPLDWLAALLAGGIILIIYVDRPHDVKSTCEQQGGTYYHGLANNNGKTLSYEACTHREPQT